MGVWSRGRGGQGGYVRRIEVVKVPKKSRGVRSGGGGGGVRVDVYVEWKLLRGWSERGGVLVARLGVVGDVGYGEYKLRIEGIVKCT